MADASAPEGLQWADPSRRHTQNPIACIDLVQLRSIVIKAGHQQRHTERSHTSALRELLQQAGSDRRDKTAAMAESAISSGPLLAQAANRSPLLLVCFVTCMTVASSLASSATGMGSWYSSQYFCPAFLPLLTSTRKSGPMPL